MRAPYEQKRPAGTERDLQSEFPKADDTPARRETKVSVRRHRLPPDVVRDLARLNAAALAAIVGGAR